MTDLRRLRHALAVAEHRNYARAAASLHITQPALTRSIQALEADLGARLFDRGPRGVAPTALGELVLEHARQLDLSARDLHRELELAKGLDTGQLSVVAGPFGAAVMLGVVLGRLCERHPRLRTEVVVAPWQELPARLRSRQAELMVADVSEAETLEDVEVQALQPHPMVVVCRAGHPLTRLTAPTLASALQHPWAGPRLSRGAAQLLGRHLAGRVRVAEDAQRAFAVTCDSSPLLKSVLAQSDAVSVMSLFMVLPELQRGELAAVTGVELALQARFGVARLRGRSLSAAGRVFVELLQAHDEELAEQERAWLAERAAVPGRKAKARQPRA